MGQHEQHRLFSPSCPAFQGGVQGKAPRISDHHTLDTAFEEDDRPWIESSPRGMLAVAILRRLAYNLLTLFRSVTQRSDARRATPWLDLLRWFYNAVISASDHDVFALRARALAMPP